MHHSHKAVEKLHRAIQVGQLDVAKKLIREGANTDQVFGTLLCTFGNNVYSYCKVDCPTHSYNFIYISRHLIPNGSIARKTCEKVSLLVSLLCRASGRSELFT